MPRPTAWSPEPLERPTVLFVEGSNDLHFFDRALKHLGRRDQVAIRHYDGKDNLGNSLPALALESGFGTHVKRLVIVRDADDSAQGAFQAITAAIQAMKWTAPPAHKAWTPAHPGLQVSGYVLPDGRSQGELETLLHQALVTPKVAGCIDAFLACARQNGAPVPRDHQESKHRFFATLSTLAKPTNLFGILADVEGDSFWASSVFAELLEFLRSI